jgi:hypothetical protein
VIELLALGKHVLCKRIEQVQRVELLECGQRGISNPELDIGARESCRNFAGHRYELRPMLHANERDVGRLRASSEAEFAGPGTNVEDVADPELHQQLSHSIRHRQWGPVAL